MSQTIYKADQGGTSIYYLIPKDGRAVWLSDMQVNKMLDGGGYLIQSTRAIPREIRARLAQYDSLSYDPELPAGYQDADIEMASMEEESRLIEQGICPICDENFKEESWDEHAFYVHHPDAKKAQKRPVDLIFPEGYERKRAGFCPTCGEPVSEFRDELSKKEYQISGMCQSCQDEVFGKNAALKKMLILAYADWTRSPSPTQICSSCKGYGDIEGQTCSACKGKGKVKASKTAEKMVFDEAYGELSYKQRSVYKKYNVSPADHDMLVAQYGDNREAIIQAVVDGSQSGIFRWNFGSKTAKNWVEAVLRPYSKVNTKKELKEAVQRINQGEPAFDVDVEAYFSPMQAGTMGLTDLLSPDLSGTVLIVRSKDQTKILGTVENVGGKLKLSSKTARTAQVKFEYDPQAHLEEAHGSLRSYLQDLIQKSQPWWTPEEVLAAEHADLHQQYGDDHFWYEQTKQGGRRRTAEVAICPDCGEVLQKDNVGLYCGGACGEYKEGADYEDEDYLLARKQGQSPYQPQKDRQEGDPCPNCSDGLEIQDDPEGSGKETLACRSCGYYEFKVGRKHAIAPFDWQEDYAPPSQEDAAVPQTRQHNQQQCSTPGCFKPGGHSGDHFVMSRVSATDECVACGKPGAEEHYDRYGIYVTRKHPRCLTDSDKSIIGWQADVEDLYNDPSIMDPTYEASSTRRCPYCKGGGQDGIGFMCQMCQGTGKVNNHPGAQAKTGAAKMCPDCGGIGQVRAGYRCSRCAGLGFVHEREEKATTQA